MHRRKYLKIGPCAPHLDEWSLKTKELLEAYNLSHPDAPITWDEACKQFSDVNPYPSSIIIEVPSLIEQIRLTVLKKKRK